MVGAMAGVVVATEGVVVAAVVGLLHLMYPKHASPTAASIPPPNVAQI